MLHSPVQCSIGLCGPVIRFLWVYIAQFKRSVWVYMDQFKGLSSLCGPVQRPSSVYAAQSEGLHRSIQLNPNVSVGLCCESNGIHRSTLIIPKVSVDLHGPCQKSTWSMWPSPWACAAECA